LGIGFALNLLDNEIISRIEGCTLVTTGKLLVDAQENGTLVTVSVGGAGSEKDALGGSVAANVVSNKTDAHISERSAIDVDGSVEVLATDNTVSVSVAGGLAFSKRGAVGAGIGVNLIWNETTAVIDSSRVKAGSTLDIKATAEEWLIGVAIGGAGAQKLAIGGAVSVNDINNTVVAKATNSEGLPLASADPDAATAALTAGGNISLAADDSSTMIVIAGGFAGAKTAAVGAAIGTTHVGNQIFATIDNTAVTSLAGGLVLRAGLTKPADDDGLLALNSNLVGVDLPQENSGQILNLTIGGAGSGKVAGGLGIAVNIIDNHVEAGIVNGAVVATHSGVVLEASDSSVIDALTFGGAGAGKVAGGGAIAASVIANTVKTRIDQSTVSTGVAADGALVNPLADVRLVSSSSAIIRTLGLGVSGAGSVAVSVAALGNAVANEVTATISGSTVLAGGDVSLTAADMAPLILPKWMLTAEQQADVDQALEGSPIELDANILALQVSVAGSGKVAVGAALMGNVITNTVQNAISNSTVRAGVLADGTVVNSEADVRLATLSDAGIIAISVGVGASGKVAIQASGFGNVITNTVSAEIKGNSTVMSGGQIALTATDQSQIRSLGLSIAGSGSVAASVLIGANVITNTVVAEIAGSRVDSGSTLDLTAKSDADILGLTLGVAASGQGAGMLSLSANVITNTTRAAIVGQEIADTMVRSDVDADDAITLSANDSSEINTLAIGVSASGSGAVGAALAANVIVNTVAAEIGDSDVDTDASLAMTADSSAIIRTAAVGVSASGTVAVQLTVMGNVIANDVSATISDSTVTATGNISLAAEDKAPNAIPFMDAVGDYVPDDDGATDPDAEDSRSTRDRLAEAVDGSPVDPDTNILSLLVSVAGTGGVAVNGAFVGNVITNSIEAGIDNSTVTSTAGDITIDTDSKAGIIALTVGVAGSGTVAVNATGFGNVIANSVAARIAGGSTVTTEAAAGLIRLTADDASQIRSLAVSVAGTGAVAIGALIGANVITNSVVAEIAGSTVDSGSTLQLAAANDADILSLTVGVAASGAGAGLLSLSANVISNTTRAALAGQEISETLVRSDVDVGGAITLSAKDTSEINTLAVGVSATGGVAGGAAVAANVIANTVATEISDSDVDTQASLIMTADASAIIRTLAIGVSGSGAAAVQLTVMGNVIANDVWAKISNSTVTAAGDISLAAEDKAPNVIPFMDAVGDYVPDDDGDPDAEDTRSTRARLAAAVDGSPVDLDTNILSLMVSVAGTGGVAVSGAFTGNVIANSIEAAIDNSTVTSTSGNITIDTDSKAGIIALTVGVAGSGAVAINATGFGNVITNTVAARIQGGSTVTTETAGGLIRLTADDASRIRSLAVSVAGTGGIAAGALIGANVITNSVVAETS
jgi:hypothetical protein